MRKHVAVLTVESQQITGRESVVGNETRVLVKASGKFADSGLHVSAHFYLDPNSDLMSQVGADLVVTFRLAP